MCAHVLVMCWPWYAGRCYVLDSYMADGSTREVKGSDGFRALNVNPAVPPAVSGGSVLPRYLGVLGMPGLAAYAGIARLIGIKPGMTVVVSSAAGAVGLVAAQVAKVLGARVVGATGSDEKVKYLQSCGIDAFNYRSAEGKRLEGTQRSARDAPRRRGTRCAFFLLKC